MSILPEKAIQCIIRDDERLCSRYREVEEDKNQPQIYMKLKVSKQHSLLRPTDVKLKEKEQSTTEFGRFVRH